MEQKVKHRNIDEKTRMIQHLNRIAGQVNGIKRMIEEDRYCDDILIQLSAVSQSVKSLANNILAQHMHTCVIDEIKKDHTEIIDDVLELMKRFQS